ncbi:MAG: chromosome segregation protein SMC, partial [Eubacteriales bacterium]
MYLKSLEFQGFKSFPDKTKLTFEKGATVIVGPNGSGKSNISDAMRWVLGEISPKSIRGAKMEDIIFGGTESRKPMGYAEVSVSFDNTGDEGGRLDSPYDEVTVTRRYYRAGESEYFINRKPVRLKDIYELFMNTGIGRDGYSIVGQGKIAEIISQKSEERRGIFEDASGIARYRHKKSEAERKLAATEDNMLRINDILSELEGRVEPLEKEAAKAKKYLELYELKKQADVRLWIYDTEKLRADVAEAEKAYKLSEIELQGAEDALAALEAQNDKLFEAVQSSKMESEDLLAKIREQIDINHALESDFKVGESNIAHIDELIKAAKESILSTEKAVEAEKKAKEERLLRISELEAKAEELRSEQNEKNEEVKTCASDAEKLELDIASALEEIKGLENERMDIRVRRSVLENAKSTDTDKNSSIMTELEEYRTVSEQIKKKCEAAKASADKYLSEIDRLDEEAEKNAEKTAKLSSRRRELGEEANRARLVRDSLSQRVETLKRMEEHFEGYNTSVRFVMKQYEAGSIRGRDGSACGKIYGPLSKLISVDEKYITAVETSLGANLQNIVVEDEETAKSAIFALKSAGAGRATFYPITSMKSSAPTQEVRDAARFSGFVGTADTLVKSDSRFSDIISSILGRTVIFDTIDNASAMAKSLRYRVKAVTLDGQQINPGGSFTGGSAKRDSGILSRAGEIEKLTSELKKAEKDAEKSRQAFEASEKELDVLNSESASIADRRKLIETMMNAENASYDQLAAKLDANNSLIE